MRTSSSGNLLSATLALLFALLLFFNANSQDNTRNTASTTQVYDEIVYNVPVQLEYDQDKYFVSGYEETVEVHLSSANRVQLNAEANEDTRNFRVVADLTNTPLGTSEIQLSVKGLSTAVNAEIEPKTITATIENKVTKSYEVSVQLPDNLETDGYTAEKITVNPKKVEITTGEETAKAIDKIVAPLSNTRHSFDTIKQTVNVQALDDKGQILSIMNPTPQVEVTVELSIPKKEVGLSVTTSGTMPANISRYQFTLSQQTVEIKGPQSIIDAIEVIELPVDISAIRSTTKRSVTIPTSNEYLVTTSEVEVTIIPIFYEEGGASEQSKPTQSSSKEEPESSASSEASETKGTTESSEKP